MAGCYGNSAEDRYYERMLDAYLDATYGDDKPADDYWDRADYEYNLKDDNDE